MLKRILGAAALITGGILLYKKTQTTQNSLGSSVLESIDVDVSVNAAYNQWTQFEQFPQFMQSVHEIKQLDDKHLHWRADIGGVETEWDAEITEQVPDMRIAWHSTSGARNAGVVTFHRLSDTKSRILLQLDYQPDSVVEQLGAAAGAVRREAKANLRNFKKFIEARGGETGGWRGTVTQPQLPH